MVPNTVSSANPRPSQLVLLQALMPQPQSTKPAILPAALAVRLVQVWSVKAFYKIRKSSSSNSTVGVTAAVCKQARSAAASYDTSRSRALHNHCLHLLTMLAAAAHCLPMIQPTAYL
jgi:hypothetical protein